MEESIDNMIKSNIRPWKNSNDNRMKINTNNSTNNKIIYQQRNPNYYNGINITNYDLNNNINLNNEKYSNIMNDYNQLLKEYRNIKFKYESLQHEYQNNKSIANKYRILNNNYNDLQNRTKELIIKPMTPNNKVTHTAIREITSFHSITISYSYNSFLTILGFVSYIHLTKQNLFLIDTILLFS